MNMILLSWNACSVIKGKKDLLLMSCLENKIDIFSIQETWLKTHIKSEFHGYNVIRQYRIHTSKGGVLIGIKKISFC